MNLNIVLYQPEIPQNTGNIARTCVLTNSTLHLIKPMKFKIDDKQVKRAGLDYWSELKLEIHYDEVSFKEGDFIMFGRESSGVPEEVHNAHEGIRVPMIKTSTRSLNLSNTVAIIAYEALRQIGFPEMK